MADPPDMTSLRNLVPFLKEKGLRPHRSRGQNFLVDRNVAHKIIDAAALRPEDPVIEIGPGAGALTAILARRGMNVVAVELDRGLAGALEELLYPYRKVTVLQKDALNMDWGRLQQRHFPPASPGSATLISNLPYNISTPLLYSLYKQNFPFKSAILMLQKEVALRLIAEPGGDYGALSVFSRFYTRTLTLFQISRSVFWPQPAVDSMIVSMRPRSRNLNRGEETVFWKIVQAAFQQRRKMVANSLRRVYPGARDELVSLLRQAGVAPEARAEMLSVEQFAKIARIAYNRTEKATERS